MEDSGNAGNHELLGRDLLRGPALQLLCDRVEHHEREHRAFGWDFPSLGERSDRLEEACALIKALFTAEGPVDFHGEYYRLEQAPFAPPCVQRPHPPIMVGGGGEKRTLRTLARYGDVMNVGGPPEMVRHRFRMNSFGW